MYFSSGSRGFAPDFKGCYGFPPLVALIVFLFVPVYFNLQITRKRIHHGDAHAVKPSGYAICFVVKFSTGMKLGHDHFQGRHVGGFMHVHGNTPPVVPNHHAVVRH